MHVPALNELVGTTIRDMFHTPFTVGSGGPVLEGVSDGTYYDTDYYLELSDGNCIRLGLDCDQFPILIFHGHEINHLTRERDYLPETFRNCIGAAIVDVLKSTVDMIFVSLSNGLYLFVDHTPTGPVLFCEDEEYYQQHQSSSIVGSI
jgi:hypothetical protein